MRSLPAARRPPPATLFPCLAPRSRGGLFAFDAATGAPAAAGCVADADDALTNNSPERCVCLSPPLAPTNERKIAWSSLASLRCSAALISFVKPARLDARHPSGSSS
ncbi:hypothetical protein L596_012486 [Steinernema carpocapsae]|uniref:Uncharacterized protein n=1 Tax=Steinernema carpocapsae TaxID=34508 RepID=A0A4V6A4T3_STECR|nr:hypothetical protein L596_012486 [Steinernema carpocapsae]